MKRYNVGRNMARLEKDKISALLEYDGIDMDLGPCRMLRLYVKCFWVGNMIALMQER